ncbi:hypothetical protein BC829DRAFT_405292 [Chytridium lagenaria]|nr:hypothetical protein BC829DRAFT_405292 [Chytridium lagenaria]
MKAKFTITEEETAVVDILIDKEIEKEATEPEDASAPDVAFGATGAMDVDVAPVGVPDEETAQVALAGGLPYEETAHEELAEVTPALAAMPVPAAGALPIESNEAVPLIPKASKPPPTKMAKNALPAGARSSVNVATYRVDEIVWVEAILLPKYCPASVPFLDERGVLRRMETGFLNDDIVFWPAKVVAVVGTDPDPTLWGTPIVLDSSKNANHIFVGTTAFFGKDVVVKRPGYLVTFLHIPDIKFSIPEIYVTPFSGVEVPKSIILSSKAQIKPYLDDPLYDITIGSFLLAIIEAHSYVRELAIANIPPDRNVTQVRLGTEVLRVGDIIVTSLVEPTSQLVFVWKGEEDIAIMGVPAVVMRKDNYIVKISKGLKSKRAKVELKDVVCRFHHSYADVVVDACPRKGVKLQLGGPL